MSPSTRSTRTSRPALRLARYLIPLVLAGLAVHLLLPQLSSFEHSLQVLRSMLVWAVALALLAQVVSYLGSGYMVQSTVELVGQRATLMGAVLVTLVSWSVGLVAGGMVGIISTTYRWSRARGISAEGSTLAAWLPGLLNSATLILVSCFGLLHLLLVHELSTLQAVAFAAALMLLGLTMGAVVWVRRNPSSATTILSRAAVGWAKLLRRRSSARVAKRTVGRLVHTLDALQNGGWQRPALGSVVNTLFDMLTLYLLFVAAGHAVSPGVLLAGYGLPLLIGKLPLLPGGVGIVEGTMAALYTSLGVPDAVSVVVIIGYRVFSFWIPTLLGFVLSPLLTRVGRESGHAR